MLELEMPSQFESGDSINSYGISSSLPGDIVEWLPQGVVTSQSMTCVGLCLAVMVGQGIIRSASILWSYDR